ncbi:YigZ family protein [Pontibacterium sp. N1Y112]|uniref:YigZ family protein n=1 Tax=Pontibacterium sinense TaxID=2781979 RepID=A0A8J7FFL9_9GAMM|nr:YigZ family protein [Pontibacterium sinense]MBE9398599.1 YigZ family protein [Pontibacterium sinense]
MSNYQRPSHRQQSELIIKNSRFITTVAPTPDKTSADAFVQQLREEHPSANHNCWAYVAGSPDDSRHWGCSDDGEPKGTAGRPMLNVLSHSGLGDISVVVTRYFGGIKLGTGGLVRAYSQAVREGLDILDLENVVAKTPVRISADFSMTGQLEYLLGQFDVNITQRDWQAQLLIEGLIETSKLEDFQQALQPYPAITLSKCE